MASKGPKQTAPRKAPVRIETAAAPAPAETAVAVVEVARTEAVRPAPAAAKVGSVKPVPRPALPVPALPAAAPIAAEPAKTALEVAKATVQNVAVPVAKAAETIVSTTAEAATNTARAVTASADATVQKEAKPMTDLHDTATQKTQFMFGDVNDRAKAAMEKSARIAEEMNDFAKGNLEAMVESSRIAAKGVETLGQEAAEYSRKSFEHATAAMKNMASVKSPTELFKLQGDYVRTAFDAYVAEASKATEHMLKLSSDAMQPLSNRMAVAADKVKTVA